MASEIRGVLMSALANAVFMAARKSGTEVIFGSNQRRNQQASRQRQSRKSGQPARRFRIQAH